MSIFLVLLLLGVGVTTGTIIVTPPRQLPILYNSTGESGPLLNGILIGLRDSQHEENHGITPKFLDLTTASAPSLSRWIIQNSQTSIVSLLTSTELAQMCHLLAVENSGGQQIRIFTPISLDDTDCAQSNVTVISLQMNMDAKILAILHRMTKVGTKSVLPVLDHIDQLRLLKKYQRQAIRSKSNVRFLDPVFVNQANLFGSKGNESSGVDSGILFLGSQELRPKVKNQLIKEEHFFRWFAHEWNTKTPNVLGLYSVAYVGAGQWDNVKRRRLLREFSKFTGPTPTILSVVLAYDTARVAVTHLRHPHVTARVGISGDLDYFQGYRRQGIFFGISKLPRTKTSTLGILYASDWLLEDLMEITTSFRGHTESTEGFPKLRKYEVATSSVITKHELIKISQAGQERRKCIHMAMEVMTHDPFSQGEYTFHFVPNSVPDHLLIPNQYGYGLTFKCHGKASTVLRIACVPDDKSVGEPVHCFKSGVIQRHKRSSFPHSYYSKAGTFHSPQKDTSMSYYQPLSDPSASNVYTPYYDASTQGTLAPRIDVPINEDPTPSPALITGGSKLPELRQILKAAKPFVGSCIGSSTGCAICVLVLGRLPLGAVPAACTGPCFVGTFGTCGSLLGRVFSETTIICTELFRQGRLDMKTFIADAEFGRLMAKSEPVTLLGYHVLASPLVERMKDSETLTRIVAYFARPWADHMKYATGYTDEFNWIGYLIHTIGSACSYTAGYTLTYVNLNGSSLESLGYSVGVLIFGVVVICRRLRSTK